MWLPESKIAQISHDAWEEAIYVFVFFGNKLLILIVLYICIKFKLFEVSGNKYILGKCFSCENM